MTRRGINGDLLEPQAADADLHACVRGWTGADSQGRPIPCPTCRPHRLRSGHPLPAPVIEQTLPIARERSEDVPAKAARLLASGSVTLELVTPDRVRARVQGDTGRYEVRRDDRGWRCTCPARRGCSHITACSLVTRTAA